jgi:hypothetical protein
MRGQPDLQSAQYETMDRRPEENMGSYVLRFAKTRRKKYSYEDRITLAKLQMELREEIMEPDAEIDPEGLFYLEALLAALDYSYTFSDEEAGTDEYRTMLDHRKRLLKFIKSRLKGRGIIPKTAKTTNEMIIETEQMVSDIAPIREITKRLQAAAKKILEES